MPAKSRSLSRSRPASLFGLLVAFGSSESNAQSLYGIRFDDGMLFAISTVDASSTSVASTGLTQANNLVLGGDGYLYAVANFPRALYRIDPSSGAATWIGPGHPANAVGSGALATNSDGVTYGIGDVGGGDRGIFRVDLATGAASPAVVLSHHPCHISGAVFRPDGVLVAFGNEDAGLVTIDPATGSTQFTHHLTPPIGFGGDMTILGGEAYFATSGIDGTPYTGSNELWRVDLYTGVHTLIGSLGTAGSGLGIGGLAGDSTPQGTLFCFGDGTGATCPCGNTSGTSALAGCLHSLGMAGAIRASGFTRISSDSLVLRGTSLPNSTAVYLQGTTNVAGGNGIPFGDGLRCVGGSVVRLGMRFSAGGASQYPGPGNASVSVRGNVSAGDVRHYQVWYRNAASFCTAHTFNLTNGLTIVWLP